VLSLKKGDQQSRAELLAKMLQAGGEKSYMLKIDSGKTPYFIVMLKANESELEIFKSKTGSELTMINFGKLGFIPLQPVKEMLAGQIGKEYYDPTEKKWTRTVVLSPFVQ